jgi:ABC-type antimicrobial peptide transport system permease subunit
MKSVSMITIFMDSIMFAIVAFLCIVSSKLIYSLMLSDVENKTYEIGMLRALGFNTTDVKALITS